MADPRTRQTFPPAHMIIRDANGIDVCRECGEPVFVQPLSDRQIEVARLMAAGYSRIEIAERLCISPQTVAVHRNEVYARIHAHNRHDFTLWAARNGLLPDSKED